MFKCKWEKCLRHSFPLERIMSVKLAQQAKERSKKGRYSDRKFNMFPQYDPKLYSQVLLCGCALSVSSLTERAMSIMFTGQSRRNWLSAAIKMIGFWWDLEYKSFMKSKFALWFFSAIRAILMMFWIKISGMHVFARWGLLFSAPRAAHWTAVTALSRCAQ